MTITEILQAKGIEDNVISDIIAEMKSNKIFTASEENLDVRYGKLKTDHDALVAKDAESQKLIADLRKVTDGQEAVQQKISEYEAQIAQAQEELNQQKIESAIKIGLLSAGAKSDDIEYLIFKMNQDADFNAEMDSNGEIKGLSDKVKSMKTMFPGQFEASSSKKIDEKKLDNTDETRTISKDEFNKMGYQSKLKLFNENPELYNNLSNN